MPELPDITVYVESIAARVLGQRLSKLRLGSPFVLRTFDPRPAELEGKAVRAAFRVGKRVVLGFEGELFAVIHLMIAGRLHWSIPAPAKLVQRRGLAAFDFDSGSLVLTEAGTKKRASIHLVHGEGAARGFNAGGIEIEGCTEEAFFHALTRENHTLKRTLTDPRLLSGIGNAYSDEILWDARMSPVKLTSKITQDEAAALLGATRRTLARFTEILREKAKGGFPEKVTAFLPEMAVHGKYGQPCPRCGNKVQRIVKADNETNYCAACQTGGKLLADRALSRLLGEDWPRSLDELEEHMDARKAQP